MLNVRVNRRIHEPNEAAQQNWNGLHLPVALDDAGEG